MRAVVLRLSFACAALLSASCAAVWGFDDATLSPDGGDASTLDSAHEASVIGMDYAVDQAADQAVERVSPAPPACTPACGFGSTCETAVGSAGVCVQAQTCTDSSDCVPSMCCVWLDSGSATGRCEAFGAASPGVQCLCVATTKPGMKPGCRTCAAPAGEMPGGMVMVCSGS